MCTKKLIFMTGKLLSGLKSVHFLTLWIVMIITILIFPPPVTAQLRVSGGGALGSGLSAGSGSSSTVWKRNPTTYWLGAVWTDPDNPSIMYSLDLMGELETRVSVGAEGRIEVARPLSPELTLTLYGSGSAFVAPFTMYGAGGGLRIIHDTGVLMFYVRSGATAFFGGSDLPEDSMLVKVDVTLGVLIPLVEVGP